MTKPEDNQSASINNYLENIIAEDNTLCLSPYYTELCANEILKPTLRLHDRKGGEQREFEISELVDKEKKALRYFMWEDWIKISFQRYFSMMKS